MSPAARQFWWRYRLLTGLLPAYLTALIYYGGGLILLEGLARPDPAAADASRLWWVTASLLLFVTLTGGWHFAYTLGFLLSAVPRRIRPAPAELAQRVAALQVPALPQLRLELLELGDRPFLGVAPRRVLYASSHSLAVDDEVLRCLLAHEQAHAALLRPAYWLAGLSWLLALPLCWLVYPWPLLIPVLAAMHVSLWLRWQARAGAAREAAADRLAAEAVGRERYLKALLPHLALFEQPDSTALRKSRLRGMGLSAEEIETWLSAPAQSGQTG